MYTVWLLMSQIGIYVLPKVLFLEHILITPVGMDSKSFWMVQ